MLGVRAQIGGPPARRRLGGESLELAIHKRLSGDPLHACRPAVEGAIADIAVAVMQLRGEPTRFDRILGEILLGLDHLGHLRRLVGTPRTLEEEDQDAQRGSGLFGVVSDAPDGTTTATIYGESIFEEGQW